MIGKTMIEIDKLARSNSKQRVLALKLMCFEVNKVMLRRPQLLPLKFEIERLELVMRQCQEPVDLEPILDSVNAALPTSAQEANVRTEDVTKLNQFIQTPFINCIAHQRKTAPYYAKICKLLAQKVHP
ncbi:hypothetical protein Fot_28144 [Forsythia ovata]|uniref:Uncharacterized protein n=1 Tax=Forsythia ovata TaxID=205694 RepID=A0ABD1TNP9_9LAMI